MREMNLSMILAIALAAMILIVFLGYLILRLMDYKIQILNPGRRTDRVMKSHKNIEKETFYKEKTLNALQKAIKITINSRNHARKIVEEIKSILKESIEYKNIRNVDMKVLINLKPETDKITELYEKLLKEKKDFIPAEELDLIKSLVITFSDFSSISDQVLNIKNKNNPEDFEGLSELITSKYQQLIDLHNSLIKQFQERFSQSLA